LENFELVKQMKTSQDNIISKVELNTNGNRTLIPNTIYDIISSSLIGSQLTLPIGTKIGQVIEILVSVSGFDANNTFTIAGNINGVPSSITTIRSSFVDYKFIWSQSSQTWVSPHTVIN